MNRIAKIILICCIKLFCAASASAQDGVLQDTSSCQWLRQWIHVNPRNQQEAIQANDTLRMYVEKCAANDDQSAQAFRPLTAAVQLYAPADTTRYDRYRDWLIKVLDLNSSQEYFCACVGAISGTYQYGKYFPLGYLAVLNYLRTTPCDDPGLEREFTKDSTYYFSKGYDPSHLPCLDSLGLGFLVKSDVKSPVSQLSSQYLASFTSSPNPFVKETTLQFALTRMTYITIVVYDELGRLVWGDGKGSSFEAGTHTVTLDGKNLPHGTLYARISTGFGEVRTVKLLHE